MKKIKQISTQEEDSNNVHDSLFVKSLSNLEIAQDFLQQYLPQPLCERLDFTTLHLCKDKFIDTKLVGRITDILYRLKLKNNDQDVYVATLIEHRSTPQKYMPLRVLHYQACVMKGHLEMYKKVPLVYSIVYYNGEKKWHYPLDIKALINAPAELVQQYALQPFQLIELNEIPDNILRQHTWSGILSLTMKHIYDRDVLPILKDMMTALQELEKLGPVASKMMLPNRNSFNIKYPLKIS